MRDVFVFARSLDFDTEKDHAVSTSNDDILCQIFTSSANRVEIAAVCICYKLPAKLYEYVGISNFPPTTYTPHALLALELTISEGGGV